MTIKTQILQNTPPKKKTKTKPKPRNITKEKPMELELEKTFFLSFNLNALESLDIVRKTMHILCGRNKVLTMWKYDHHVNR